MHRTISAKKTTICKIPRLVIVSSQKSHAHNGLSPVRSKLLRAEQGVHQVDKQTKRRDSGNDVIHGLPLLQLVASLGEGPARKQNDATYSDVQKIEHLNLLRFFENHFVADTAQLPSHFLLPSWPPSLLRTNNHNGTRTQDIRQCLHAIAAQINLYCCFHRTLAGDQPETPLVEFNQYRRGLQRKRIRHDLGHQERDSRAQAARQSAGLFQGRERRLYGREDHSDVQPLTRFLNRWPARLSSCG